jgi:hypothetical protein
MTLFEMAVKARLPMISAHTDDLINADKVVRFYAGKSCQIILCETISGFPGEGKDTIVMAREFDCDLQELYEQATVHKGQVIFLNLEDNPDGQALDVGTIPVPDKLMSYNLAKLVGPDLLPSVNTEMRGLSITRALEVVQLTSGHYGDVEARNLRQVKRMLVPPTPGLDEVDLDVGISIPREELHAFLTAYKGSWEAPNAGPLSPRGLLLRGAPGAGKTHMAKVLAKELGVPLYRASLGGAMDRWHGQSEQNLRRMLASAESEAPCVLLIDEVEKEINTSDDSAVASRMLASLLWWLAEHRSKVITVMTTNDISKLPAELYRPGRVNEVIEVKGLDLKAAKTLVMFWLKQYVPNYTKELRTQVLVRLFGNSTVDETFTPAYIEGEAMKIIREHLV